ncbi:hypothetical protein BH09BAC6_BH09BAC6_11680 [soil metagenome]|jgi:hypothetical protein
MKTLSKFGVLCALAGSLFLSSCAGSYYVSDQPAEPVYERPVVPYAGAVWIDGDWGWSGGRYVYHNGYWARPRVGRTYIRGTWERGNRGYTWRRGHWRR